MFPTISEAYRNYNIFIPVDEKAEAIWEKYKDCCKVEDDFERKRKIKEIKPELLQYVTRFPKNKYTPPDDKKENSIIYEKDWERYYDIKTGFKLNQPDDDKCVIF